MKAPPAPSGDTIDFKALNGALLLISVHEHKTDISTTFGTADAIRCDVAVLDGDRKGDVLNDTLIFPKLLVGSLRQVVGDEVLGRLGQGTAKPGQSPPWILNEPSDADFETGRKYEAYRKSQELAQSEPF